MRVFVKTAQLSEAPGRCVDTLLCADNKVQTKQIMFFFSLSSVGFPFNSVRFACVGKKTNVLN